MKPTATKINRLVKAVVVCALVGLAPGGARGQALEQVLKSFGYRGAANPPAALIQGNDGALYGTSQSGGTFGYGTVFRLSANGTGYTSLRDFAGPGWPFGVGVDGANPCGGLVQGTDGALYGTTVFGGTNNHGMVFKLGTDGTGYTPLHVFTGAGGDGATPYAGLVQGSDGTLYGTTYNGGTSNLGTVFKLGTNGAGYAVLYSFTGAGEDGANPYAGLVQGSDGALYGTTVFGGTNGYGMVFKLNTDGTGYTPFYSFAGAYGDGPYPSAALVQGSDGTLYGTTYNGGTSNLGTVFKLGTNGAGYTVLYSFTGAGEDGANPYAGLVQGSDGGLYGTTVFGGTNGYGTVFKLGTNGAGYTVLYSFTGTGEDGANPYAGLVQGSDGALYGMTYNGGTYGDGMAFTLSANGAGCTPFYSFTGAAGDGQYPSGELVQGNDGTLYGTTYNGGTNDYGTVFKLGTDGTGYTPLHVFTGPGGDGATPYAGLVQGSDGALYGTTYNGGTSNLGTVFKLGTNGAGYTVLYSFTGAGEDGANPYAGLVQGSDGALYGTTVFGGTNGYGMVFKLGTDGSGYTALHNFTGAGNDGAYPYGGLVQSADSALYGTTYEGGSSSLGTVFKLGTNGAGYTVLYGFTGAGEDGGNPYAGLVQGSDGGLYGTTVVGGTNGCGTVFKLGTYGACYTPLHSCVGGDDPYPWAGLAQGSDGALYGTTRYGGTATFGTVFKLSTNGTGFSLLYTFTFHDGWNPWAKLLKGSDGALYGTTHSGGTFGYGTVFRLSAAPFTLQLGRLPDCNVALSTVTLPTGTLQIAVSTNLVDWTALTNLAVVASIVQINDLAATNYPRRFYRAMWAP